MTIATPYLIYSIAGMLLFALGLHGLITLPHLLRKIIAMNVMAGGVFLFLISIAARNTQTFPDPVPQAMLLTGVVVALSATAFAVALARRIYSLTGQSELDAEEDADV
jgi:multicomponent Na+:H+ antiporter subunit C